MYPFTRAKRLQLRQEESLDGRGVRNRGWLAGQFRGEHERGHRTHTTVETPDYIYGGNLYVHRSADRVACLPRQFGQGPLILRGNLSTEPGTDFHLHGRGA